MIRITSKQNGFRRCGIAHRDTPKTYPDDWFSAEQLNKLKAEPMLIVDVVPDEPAAPAEPTGEPDKGKKSKKAAE